MCFKSKRSFRDRNSLKAPKVPSALSGPPLFSLLSTRSLKSAVKNHGSLEFGFSSASVSHPSLLLEWSGSP